MKDFEPNIVGFLCNWCSYAGADLAGTSRIKYPSNIKSIRVPLPSIPEQRAIVSVLSDMNSEIAILEALLEKTRDIKEGIMQRLLTGQVRVTGVSA